MANYNNDNSQNGIKRNDNFDEIQSLISDNLDWKGTENVTDQMRKERANYVTNQIQRMLSTDLLKEKLNVFYEYEKHYLEILKQYKEELKFAAALQEDIRKERSKFFAETLKEVSTTLKSTGVNAEIQNEWIKELVASYTKSLDLSSGLVEEQIIDTLGDIKKEEKQIISETQKE